jgi:D-alanyl-D-alanine carboxypeptidase/D-alanyl-D-alanine-endopeptidase (penicillin-binding protein 4)
VTTIGITRSLVNNGFQVWGDFPLKRPGFKARLALHKPALWAANLFLDKLRARGIAVDGNASMTDVPGRRERFDPEREVELAYLTSRSLGEVSRGINKESLNLDSELVLRTLGKEKGATVPDPDPRKMSIRGDDKAGVAVIRQWLEDKGIATQGLALHDGSGLSRLDVVTPESTARLLEVVSKLSTAGIFRDSLPIAGRDGTLRNRLRSASARVFAKTGTLTYTNSLSGYVATRSGELLAFSILCNNDTSLSTSTRILDEIALLLAGR